MACHGYSHQLIYGQTPAVFRAETVRAKACLEDQAQRPVLGYRAASYSITKRSLWALDILAELGFAYDSSIFPVHHDRYGIPGSPRWPYRLDTPSGGSLIEFPPSTLAVGGYRLPVAGGGYFRIYPYQLTRFALSRINRLERTTVHLLSASMGNRSGATARPRGLAVHVSPLYEFEPVRAATASLVAGFPVCAGWRGAGRFDGPGGHYQHSLGQSVIYVWHCRHRRALGADPNQRDGCAPHVAGPAPPRSGWQRCLPRSQRSDWLGHTRLSIIDLAGGAQPMPNEDQTVWVSFNGEIFNYIELRETLLKAGHCFSTHSDTEVIVHAYEQYGDDFVQHLNGQFAIALWDANRQRLLLIRDRVGILPLFYTRQGERLLFASEIKALLPLLAEAPRISPAALDQIFTFWAPRSPNTLFEDIFEVPPGHMLVLENGHLRESVYWDWRFPEQGDYLTGSDAELAEQLYELLADATRIRLRADVPVGAYLSGGLDSSALVALIRRHSAAPLKTFSIGFEEKSLDESAFQQQMVEHLGVEHSRIFCHNRDIAEDFPANHLPYRNRYPAHRPHAHATAVRLGARLGIQGGADRRRRRRSLGRLRSVQGSQDSPVLGP